MASIWLSGYYSLCTDTEATNWANYNVMYSQLSVIQGQDVPIRVFLSVDHFWQLHNLITQIILVIY